MINIKNEAYKKSRALETVSETKQQELGRKEKERSLV